MGNLEKRIDELEMEIKSLRERTEKIDAVNEAFRERLVSDIPGRFKQRKDKGDMVYHFYPPRKEPYSFI